MNVAEIIRILLRMTENSLYYEYYDNYWKCYGEQWKTSIATRLHAILNLYYQYVKKLLQK